MQRWTMQSGNIDLSPSSSPPTPSVEMKSTSSTPRDFISSNIFHPVMLTFRVCYPKPQYVFATINIIGKDGIDGTVFRPIITLNGDEHTVYKEERDRRALGSSWGNRFACYRFLWGSAHYFHNPSDLRVRRQA